MSIATIDLGCPNQQSLRKEPWNSNRRSHVLRSKDELLPNHQRVVVNVEVIEYVQPVLL